MPEHYQRPGWFTTNVFNRVVAGLTRLGVSVYGSRVLEVTGRKSGEWRQTPVNLAALAALECLADRGVALVVVGRLDQQPTRVGGPGFGD
jgi:hypothetical protein